MAVVKFIYTTSAKLNDLPVEDGQIIFVPDMSTIGLDTHGQRSYFHTIKNFETDAERLATAFPVQGFYWVEETETLWRWNRRWTPITASSSGSVVGGNTVSEFPQKGAGNTLYYTDDGIYN